MSKQTDSRTPAAHADSHQQMGMRWRERAEKLELQALRHSGTYGKGNDVYVSFIARAETLKDCANELEFHCEHEWHALARLPKGWQDVCVKCGDHRMAHTDQAQRPAE